jgi:ArsR family transcriptional regulator
MDHLEPGKALRYFKALSDETRLRLLNILGFREFNVQELTGILEMGQSRISRHLKLLVEGGLVECRRDGLWSFYRAVTRDPHLRFFDAIRYLFEQEQIYRRDLEKSATVLRTGDLESIRFFDSVAPNWEIMKRSVIGELDLVGEIVRAVDRFPSVRCVADLGCGSGALLERLTGTGKTVIGVDSSREMLAETAKRLGSKAEEVDLRIGELEHLPLSDGEAGVAIINLVLHHLRNPRRGLLEARRVLRPGGGLILADFLKHEQEMMRSRYGDRWLGFPSGDIESWLSDEGFRIDELEQHPVRNGLRVLVYRCSKPRQSPPKNRKNRGAGGESRQLSATP